MKIQQHDGVVVDAAVIAAGLRRASAREREVLQGRREAPKAVFCCPPAPPLYIGPQGGAQPLEIQSPRAGAPLGGLYKEGEGGQPHPCSWRLPLPLLHLLLP